MPGVWSPPAPPRRPSIPTSTTVASALSGIFSSSFSSCLDLERVMPAGGGGARTSLWGGKAQVRARPEDEERLQDRGRFGRGGGAGLTSRSTSIRVSCSTAWPAMRGSVTAGSLPSPTWLVLWWCTSSEPRLPAEMLRGKEKSFSSLGWLRDKPRAVSGGPTSPRAQGAPGTGCPGGAPSVDRWHQGQCCPRGEQSPGEWEALRSLSPAHLCLSSSARSTLARSSARIWSVMTICSTTW